MRVACVISSQMAATPLYHQYIHMRKAYAWEKKPTHNIHMVDLLV